MTEFEKLAFDYDQFEYDFDTYGYEDAVDNRENGLVLARKALADPEFREQIIERLVDIAEECDDYTEEAMALADRVKRYHELQREHMNKRDQMMLDVIVKSCGSYKSFHEAINERPEAFTEYGITTYLNEVNTTTQDAMSVIVKSLTCIMGTDEDIHYGYNNPEQGETGEDGGKYYVFVDC